MKDSQGHGSNPRGEQAAHQSMVRKILASGDLKSALAHAVTGYDRRQEARNGYYNQYALGHYLGATERIHGDVQKGVPLVDAINNHTNGPLANAIHRSLGTGGKGRS